MAKLFSLRSVLCGLLLGVSITAQAETVEKTLDNGLKLIVRTDERAPVVVSQLWYRVGSVDESQGLTGVSHALEHMMFRGTQQVGDGEFSRRIAALGGKHNAFTSRDYTVYFEQLAADRVEEAIRLEADRMGNLRIADDLFAKEIQVIREERRLRTDDQPTGVLFEQLSAQALVANPARHPIIGWADDLHTMQASDLRRWYQMWYAPNNATLVIVGAVKPEHVFRMAEKHFGVLPKRPIPNIVPRQEPEPLGLKRFTVHRPSELSYLAMAWQVPRLSPNQAQTDAPALAMLAAVLDGLESSRLPKTLVREQKSASSVNMDYDMLGRGAALFTITAVPAAGVAVTDMEMAIRKQLAQLVKHGVSDSELQRLRTQMRASRVYEKDSLFGQAMNLGRLASLGFDWRQEDTLLEQLLAVTSADIQRVAQRYLVDQRLTVGVLLPEKTTTVAIAKGAKHAN